jgi:predicted dehydrogenase/sRNA-binding carbon storage regulator CsrA
MFVLSRSQGDAIDINRDIIVTVSEIKPRSVALRVTGPRRVLERLLGTDPRASEVPLSPDEAVYDDFATVITCDFQDKVRLCPAIELVAVEASPDHKTVRIGIQAPKEVAVERKELIDKLGSPRKPRGSPLEELDEATCLATESEAYAIPAPTGVWEEESPPVKREPGRRLLGVGVIGCGGISSSQHLPHWMSCPDTELIAVADVNHSAVTNAAKTFRIPKWHEDWRHIIDDPSIDIVDITTPNFWHAPMALAALEAGKHVLCEKPMAGSTADATKMILTARRLNLRFMINHVFRFTQTAKELTNLIETHKVPDFEHGHVRWTRRGGIPWSPTFTRKNLAIGGSMLDLGVHMLDMAWWMMGRPAPTRICAQVRSQVTPEDPIPLEVDDFGTAFIHFDNGATLFAEISWRVQQLEEEERFVRLYGPAHALRWPEGLLILPNETLKAPPLRADSRDHYREAIHSFARCIIEQTPEPILPEECLQSVRLVEAIYHSAELKREVTLEKCSLLKPREQESA